MTVELSREHVAELLEEIVRGKEDYVYRSDHERCDYVDGNSQPSCLVGHVLARAGVDMRIFRGSLNGVGIDGLVDGDGKLVGGVVMDHETMRALALAQNMQDTGRSWGDAKDAYAAALTGEWDDRYLDDYDEDGEPPA